MSASSATVIMRQSAAVALQVAHEQGYDAALALGFAAVRSRDAAERHLERGNVNLSDAGYDVADLLDASRARLLARRAASPIPESRIEDEPAPQRSEWFECDRPGCDAIIGVVGDPDPDEPWDDYDPIGEHIAAHEREDAAMPLERGDGVRVVAATLGNGAPHPYAGRAGVVLEVRDAGMHPVRVRLDGQLGGRPVMFAAGELVRYAGVVGPSPAGESRARDPESPDPGFHHGKTVACAPASESSAHAVCPA